MDEDLLPARMVNEFVYCPRLFFLEWVEARFAESDDTRLGRQVPGGWTPRPVWLRCPRRGSCAPRVR